MTTRRDTRPVHEGTPNPNGLIIGGNAWDWMNDRYGPYQGLAVVNPAGAESGDYRVLRGGSRNYYYPRFLRAAGRSYFQPVLHWNDFGFRVALPQD